MKNHKCSVATSGGDDDDDNDDKDNVRNTGRVETMTDPMPSTALQIITEDNLSTLEQSYRSTVGVDNSSSGVPAFPVSWTPS